MFTKLAEILFGCRHGNYSFPLTLKSGRCHPGSGRAGTYVVCLECGRELSYDWSRMRVMVEGENRTASEAGWEQPSGASGLLRVAAKSSLAET